MALAIICSAEGDPNTACSVETDTFSSKQTDQCSKDLGLCFSSSSLYF